MARKKNLKVNITGDSSELEKATRRAGNSIDRFVGNAKKSMAQVATAITGVIAALRGFQSAAKIMNDFEAANSRLAAVLGTSVKNIKALTDAAMELGRRTQYSASEVTDLQTELAKLGFSQSEILAMQEPVLKFAAAVGTDLASAAARAGATMRGFGLTAKETGDMLAVMAVSTSKSALSFDFLDETLGKIVPVTKGFGLDTRDTIALLGTLANAGIDASSSGTGLRRIISELADSSSKLNGVLGKQPKTMNEIIEALRTLRDRGLGVSEAMDLVGKNAGSTFLALVNGADDCRELYGELQNVDTALNDMYNTMTDNVEGAINGLKSAWEGFILKLRNSQGFLRDMIQMGTDLLGVLSGEGGFRTQRLNREAADYAANELAGLSDASIKGKLDQLYKDLERYQKNHIWSAVQQIKEEIEVAELAVPIALKANADKRQAAWEKNFGGGGETATTDEETKPKGKKKEGETLAELQAKARAYAQEVHDVMAADAEMAAIAQQIWAGMEHAQDPATEALLEDARNIAAALEVEGAAYEKFVEEQKKAEEESMAVMQKWQDQMEEFSDGLSDALQGAFTDTFANLGEFIGGALSGGLDDAAANLGAGLLDTLGSLAIQVGELAISTGVAVAGIKTALESLNPYVAIAAGAALVALGSAVRSAAGNISKGSTSAYAVGTSSYSSYPSDGYSTRQLNIKVSGTLTAGAGVLNAVIDSENTRLEHTT